MKRTPIFATALLAAVSATSAMAKDVGVSCNNEQTGFADLGAAQIQFYADGRIEIFKKDIGIVYASSTDSFPYVGANGERAVGAMQRSLEADQDRTLIDQGLQRLRVKGCRVTSQPG